MSLCMLCFEEVIPFNSAVSSSMENSYVVLASIIVNKKFTVTSLDYLK